MWYISGDKQIVRHDNSVLKLLEALSGFVSSPPRPNVDEQQNTILLGGPIVEQLHGTSVSFHLVCGIMFSDAYIHTKNGFP